jgi:hypothetical protein
MSFSPSDYSELLGLYLGDGHVVRLARTWKLRIYLDTRYAEIVNESRALLQRCFPHHSVGTAYGHEGRMTVLSVHSSHLPCLFPQHGRGMKHERRILLDRRYARSARINRRSSVGRLKEEIGVKR